MKTTTEDEARAIVRLELAEDPGLACPVGCERKGDEAMEAGEFLVASAWYYSGSSKCLGHSRAERMLAMSEKAAAAALTT